MHISPSFVLRPARVTSKVAPGTGAGAEWWSRGLAVYITSIALTENQLLELRSATIDPRLAQ